jgi:small-conductance mechanosensitive channel
MYERRVAFTLGVTYETSREKLRQIAPLLRRAVEAQEGVRFDRAHFAAYGPYSLDFEVVYFVLSADFGRHMDAKQAINFRIHEAFESLGVEFAYPTQTVWLPGGAAARVPTAGVAA